VEQHVREHNADLSWLNDQVKSIAELEPHRKVIILTHHSPTVSGIATNPANSTSQISSAFSSDLSNEICWTTLNVKIWAFGHTHFNCDFLDRGSGKRVVTNQRGYYFSQSEGFDESKVIEI
jgi:Calcineurin-like phosphoesterase